MKGKQRGTGTEIPKSAKVEVPKERAHGKGRPGLQLSPRARVTLFLIIVFPITWLIHLINWLLGGLENPIAFPLLMVLAMFVPGLAAAVMLDLVTKEGLRYAGFRWGKKRHIATAYLLMLAISLVTYGLTIIVGWGRIDNEATTLNNLLEAVGITVNIPAPVLLGAVVFTALTTAVIVNSIYAFGEELGWRGYLLPSLLHLGKLKACVISGAIWGLWHTPLIMMGHLYLDYHYLGILMMTILCILLGIIFGWLWLASGSLLPPIVAHAVLNAQLLGYFPSFLVTDVNPIYGGGTGIIGLGILAMVALWLYCTRRIR